MAGGQGSVGGIGKGRPTRAALLMVLWLLWGQASASPPIPTATPTAVCGTQIGCNTCATGGAGSSQNSLYAMKITVASAGTLASASIYFSGTLGGRVQAGIYRDLANFPGALVDQSAPQAAISGWNSLAFHESYLAAGSYWLAVNTEPAPVIWSAGPSQVYFINVLDQPVGSMPDPVPAATVFSTNAPDFYATLCTGPPYFVTATPTFTPSFTFTPTPSDTLTSTISPTHTDSPTATLSPTPQALGLALDQPGLSFLTGGSTPWTVDTTVSALGGSSLRSGSPGSWVEVTVTGPGALTWATRIQGNDCYQEFLRLVVDGSPWPYVDCWDHEFSPQTYIHSFDLWTGTHTLRWMREVSGTPGGTYWLDDVQWVQGTLTPSPTVSPTGTITVSPTVSPTFSVSPTRTISPSPTRTLVAAEGVPGGFYAFPHPAKLGQAVGFRFPADSQAELAVFSLDLRRADQPGEVQVDAANGLAWWRPGADLHRAGVYFVRLSTPGAQRRLRLVLLP